MPSVVNPHLAYARCLEQRSLFVPVGVGADRPPVGLASHEVTIVPGWPGVHPLVELGGPVGFECCDKLGRERNRAPALVGFWLGELESAACASWAGRGVPGAVGRAGVTVTILAAGMRVGAAVPPGQPLQLPPDRSSETRQHLRRADQDGAPVSLTGPACSRRRTHRSLACG